MTGRVRTVSIRFSASAFVMASFGWCGAGATVALADPPAGQWLIDRGRHIGLISDGTDVRGDAEMILVWMLAAARVSPDHPDAYWWQHDLAMRLGRTEAARAALRKYVALRPDDAVARLVHIDLSIDELQTVDRRIDYCNAAMGDAVYPEVIGDLHRRLAILHQGRGDEEAARTHVMDAIRACPRDDALVLQAEIFGPDAPAETKVAAMMSRIQASPADARHAWDLALLLDDLSLHNQARKWYQHAIDVSRTSLRSARPPSRLLLDLARSSMNGGNLEHAIDTCSRIAHSDSEYIESLSILIESLRRSGEQEKADGVADVLRERIRAIPLPSIQANDATAHGATATPKTLATVAWLHAEFDPDPVRSRDYSAAATAMAPRDPFIRRVYGLSCLINNDFDEAKRALEPLASVDQWAAEGLAQILLRDGEQTKAVAVLRRAESIRHSGIAYDRVIQRLRSLDEQPVAMPDRSAVNRILDGFDERILRFAFAPGEFVRLVVQVPSGEIRFGDPFSATVTLTNTGPFAITIGDGRMIAPRVLVSIEPHSSESSAAGRRDGYLTIALAKRLVLNPNESITVTRALDVGAARKLLFAHPSDAGQYTSAFLLDPVKKAGGGWVSRLAGFEPLHATLRRAASPSGAQQTQVLDALGHASPILRARALHALSHQQLDESAMASAAPVLSDTYWLVRLVAVDFFATRQRHIFSQVLARLSRDDPDVLVRRLASLHLARLRRGSGQRGMTQPGATAR